MKMAQFFSIFLLAMVGGFFLPDELNRVGFLDYTYTRPDVEAPISQEALGYDSKSMALVVEPQSDGKHLIWITGTWLPADKYCQHLYQVLAKNGKWTILSLQHLGERDSAGTPTEPIEQDDMYLAELERR